MPTLAEQGFVEGRNLIVDTRSAEGQLDRLPALAAELIALKPDLIVALPAPATAAVKALTSEIPIVFAFVNDPIGLHFAASLNRPGGNLTGLSNFSVTIAAKRVELLREAFPDLHRLAIWRNSAAVNDSIELAEYERAANVFGMEVLTIDARNPGEYEAAAAQSDQWKADGLCITSNPPAFNNRRIIIELAARLSKPTIYWNTIFVEDGGLISYAANFQELARRAAIYAAKILRGRLRESYLSSSQRRSNLPSTSVPQRRSALCFRNRSCYAPIKCSNKFAAMHFGRFWPRLCEKGFVSGPILARCRFCDHGTPICAESAL